MGETDSSSGRIAAEIDAYYTRGIEGDRLDVGVGRLEWARTQDLLRRFLPPPPATIVDVGGGTGAHALPLARAGYSVHLVDPVEWNVEGALEGSVRQPDAPLASACVGEARALAHDSGSLDAALVFGPMYHLTDHDERIAALREARRVLRPGGKLFAAAISRFASLLEGFLEGHLAVPEFEKIVAQDLRDGQHRNPTADPVYFTTAYFHRPEDLVAEAVDAGFVDVRVLAVEGPGWLVPDLDRWWGDPDLRTTLMRLVERVEDDPALLGLSAHLLVVGDAATDGVDG